MEVFEIVVALLVAGAALAAIARRIGAPYPALVALAGAALALIPGVPTIALDPEPALTLFVVPVLVDAAFDPTPRDLRRNWPGRCRCVVVASEQAHSRRDQQDTATNVLYAAYNSSWADETASTGARRRSDT